MDEVKWKKRYYEDGALKSTTPYVNGKLHGVSKIYHEDGALFWEIPYVNGERHGVEKHYYEDGTPRSEYYYVNGEHQPNLNKLEKLVLLGIEA